ncbi:MAG: VOC family protein [Hyphomicrobiaceae bacterium]|nr:VOC family protein [Hyphomicrobiaceae bacterium]
MKAPALVIFYVHDVYLSAAFYARILGVEPVEKSPTFAMFVLEGGTNFGLWSKHTVSPAVATEGTSADICFTFADRNALDKAYLDWTEKGGIVIQTPVELDFGQTFTIIDPDGNRLRAYVPQR